MSELSRRSILILGLLCLIGGLYQAAEIWPIAESDSAYLRYTDEYIKLLEEGKQREALSLSQQHDLREALMPVHKVTAMYWAAAGIVSWIVLWGFAAIIGELMQIRFALLQGASGRAESRSF